MLINQSLDRAKILNFIKSEDEKYVYDADRNKVQEFLSSENIEEDMAYGCIEKVLSYRRLTRKEVNAYVSMEAKK